MKTVVLKNRSHTLASVRGHTIRFDKDVPVDIPDELFAEAVAIGCQMADGTAAEVIDEKEPNKAPTEISVRKQLIEEACKRLLKRGQRDDFTAAGTPHPVAVTREAGFKVDGREVRPIWDRIRVIEEDA